MLRMHSRGVRHFVLGTSFTITVVTVVALSVFVRHDLSSKAFNQQSDRAEMLRNLKKERDDVSIQLNRLQVSMYSVKFIAVSGGLIVQPIIEDAELPNSS